MGFCLPKEFANKFIKSLKEGKIVPEKLSQMSSEERRAEFEKIVGEDAQQVNALFESKLLLKDYKTGLINWAKKVSGISEPVRNDLVARIEKMDRILNPNEEKAFLADLAAQKLGTSVTMKEAKGIAQRSKTIQEAKTKWNKEQATIALKQKPTDKNAGWSSEEARLDYGLKLSEFRNYLGDLKNQNAKLGVKEAIKHPVIMAKRVGYETAAVAKSVLASLDNSFFGRQGIKALFTNPSVWASNFKKSFGIIGKELRGKDAMTAIEADVFSRPNAMNGNYQRMGLDVGINFEEAFPTTLQERLPIIGRFFKAADVAFSGSAMRMRADLADRLVPKAEEFGLSMNSRDDARAIGIGTNALTGRGATKGGKLTNVAFFSIKFLKGNFDILTLHAFDPAMKSLSPEGKAFVRKTAATNLAKIVIAEAFILGTSKALNPDSTDFDPRSSKFGKIKIGNTTIDMTGGLASIVTLASRLVPTVHNGKWSMWYKGSKGQYVDMLAGQYGQITPLDMFENFFEGKLAPAMGVLRDIWKGENFQGQKPTLFNEATGSYTPLPIQTYFDLKNNPNSAPLLLGLIADALGFSTYTPPVKKK